MNSKCEARILKVYHRNKPGFQETCQKSPKIGATYPRSDTILAKIQKNHEKSALKQEKNC